MLVRNVKNIALYLHGRIWMKTAFLLFHVMTMEFQWNNTEKEQYKAFNTNIDQIELQFLENP